MSVEAVAIQQELDRVQHERALRTSDPDLAARVSAVKAFQHRRFEHSYADLLAQPRYAAAARFFLDDLYGPTDFTQRDAEFARVVPALVRLFPRDIVATVAALAELHALSESLDTEMARQLPTSQIDAAGYALAWAEAGREADRMRQISLMARVGQALDGYTANPLLRHSLRMMRRPAQAAGLGALQSFLERGFETFRAMRGAQAFLQTISARETELAAKLFSGDSKALPDG